MATAAVALGGSLLSSLLGGIFGNKPQEVKSSFNKTSTQDMSSTPTYDPKAQQYRDTLMNMLMGRAESTPDLSGYESSGLANINAQGDASQNNINNLLLSRGLGRTGAGATSMIQNTINRGNQTASFRNTIPLLQDQLQQGRLKDATTFFSMIPHGITGTQRSNESGSGINTQPGNPIGGGFSSLGSSLAYLYGSGAFGGKSVNPMGANVNYPQQDPSAY